MSMRTDGRGKGFKSKEKGKKGEGRDYDERRIFANSSEEAQHHVNSWVMQHKNFVFHPRHLSQRHINLWARTGENKLNLLKNIHRHERETCMSGRDPGGYGSHESLAGRQTEQNGEAEAGAPPRFCRWQIVGVEVHYKSLVCEQCVCCMQMCAAACHVDSRAVRRCGLRQ